MTRSWWVAAVAVPALVVAVLLVRPGSQASPDDVAVAPPSSPPHPAALDPLGTLVLSGLGLPDLPVRADGIGPLRLGTDVDDLVAAGWQTYDVGACSRLLPLSVLDAALGGWVVDGRLVSVQLEAGGEPVAQVASEVGFVFGVPVDRTSAQQVTVRPVGDGSRAVTTGRFESDGSHVLVSDVGGAGIRFAEVATAEGERCGLDADLLESSAFPTTRTAIDVAAAGITVADLGHRYPSTSGSTVAELAEVATWSPLVAGLSGQGCETLERVEGGDLVTLFLLDGVVVAEDYVLDTTPLRTPPYYFPGEAYQDRGDGRLVTTQQVEREAAGPPEWSSTLRTRLLVGLEVVPEIDTVVVAIGPLVERQQVGRPCEPTATR